MKRYLILLTLLFASLPLWGQGQISGKVLSAEDGQPVIGALVQNSVSGATALTDSNGGFVIEAAVKDKIEVSCLGFTTKEVAAAAKMTVYLEEQARQLDDLVVVGYTTEKRADITGAISVVDMKELSGVPTANVAVSLQGKVPGLDVSTNGAPGGVSYSMLVRGITTINDSSPLLVIDGVQTREHLSTILNPEDIESIQVLKDAASAAIYGTKASNGVIIITTKHGKEGFVNVDFSSQLSMQTVANRMEMLNSMEWGQVYWKASLNDGIVPSHPVYGDGAEPDIPEFIDSANNQRASNTDWQSEGYGTAFSQNYNLSVAAGGKYNTSFIGLNYVDDNGLLKGTNFTKYNIKINNDYKLLDNHLRIGENLNLARYTEILAPGGIHELLLCQHPLIPVHTEDGNWGGYISSLSDMNNPVRLLEEAKDNISGNWRAFGNLYVEVEPIQHLVFRSAGSLDYRNGFRKSFSPSWKEGTREITDNALVVNNNYMYDWIWTNTAAYEFKAGQFSFSGIAGIEARLYRTEYLEGKREDYLLQDPIYFYLDAGSGNQTNGNGGSEYSTYSQFGKINLNYGNRYLLGLTLRHDASSRFGKDNNSAWFPAISAGWRLGNEPFMEGLTFLDELKIRASWGRNGNDLIDNEASYSKFYINNVKASYDIGGTDNSVWPGVVKTRSANLALRWEVTTQENAGVDLSMFKNRLNVTFDIYNKDTDDMLIDRPYIGVIGEGGSYAYNGASLNTQGFEGLVSWNDRKGDFNYEVTFNFTHYKNVITSLPDDIYYTWGGGNGIDKSIVGQPLGSWFGYKANDLFRTEESLYNDIEQTGKGVGRIRYEDLSGDFVINDRDRDWLGSSNPVLTGGLNIAMAWKGIDLTLFFNGMIRKAWNNSKTYTDFFQLWLGNHGRNLLNAFDPDTNPDSDIPALTLQDVNNEVRPSTYFIEDGSFIKLKTVQLGYSLPAKLRAPLHMKTARIYATATNIFTLTRYTGLDPEVLGYSYPLPRTFTLGINVGF